MPAGFQGAPGEIDEHVILSKDQWLTHTCPTNWEDDRQSRGSAHVESLL